MIQTRDMIERQPRREYALKFVSNLSNKTHSTICLVECVLFDSICGILFVAFYLWHSICGIQFVAFHLSQVEFVSNSTFDRWNVRDSIPFHMHLTYGVASISRIVTCGTRLVCVCVCVRDRHMWNASCRIVTCATRLVIVTCGTRHVIVTCATRHVTQVAQDFETMIQPTVLHRTSHCNTPQHTATHCNTLQHTTMIQGGEDS